MKKVHITLQGKGGVGKSLVASLIAQYLRQSDKDPVCVDTDPVNATFSAYEAFNARRLELMDGTKINERHFDDLMESILGEDRDFVIDNGASSFIALSNYLIENSAIDIIGEAGKQVVLHPVITGGQALLDTLGGFDTLASQMPDNARIVVWLNEFFGEITIDGKQFEDMQAYKQHQHRVDGLVRIPEQSKDTFGRDMETMLNAKLTFDDALASPQFTLMAKQRLKMMQRAVFEQLQVVL
ncbi:ArsA-related P-loop ATPase [Xanthomonas phaseoli]|uniref:nucleotide-binding protein n=2 Tax=Xanthomonas phaseoli TaxID=1985254 RepID=UPI0002D65ABB|nr:ArsA-related P-loop ATPase [Xanthomonas phaseoli]